MISRMIFTLLFLVPFFSTAEARIITYGFESPITKLVLGDGDMLFNQVVVSGRITVDTNKYPSHDWISGALSFDGHIDWQIPLSASSKKDAVAIVESDNLFVFYLQGGTHSLFDEQGRVSRTIRIDGEASLDTYYNTLIWTDFFPIYLPTDLSKFYYGILNFGGRFHETIFEYDEFGEQSSKSREGDFFHQAGIDEFWIISDVAVPPTVLFFVLGLSGLFWQIRKGREVRNQPA